MKNVINKANLILSKYGKRISLNENTDGTYCIYLNSVLIFWQVPNNRLYLNINKIVEHNIGG